MNSDPIRVLVVDDSAVFRNLLRGLIEQDPRLVVIGTAIDGDDAIKQVKRLRPDIITMDVEMPVRDGISATREIMQSCPTPIVMVSGTTRSGADATFKALEYGALDFVAKEVGRHGRPLTDSFAVKLRRAIRTLVKPTPRQQNRQQVAAAVSPLLVSKHHGETPACVVIGASTGGPPVVTDIIEALPGDFPAPVVIVQHMPASFTGAFADRLNSVARLKVALAQGQVLLQAGRVYVAPGGMQTYFVRRGIHAALRVTTSSNNEIYKPSINRTLNSAAEVFGDKILAVILTGMGADGCDGARELKARGANVWAQDEKTSAVYGMPRAVADAGLVDAVLSAQDIAPRMVAQW